MIFQKGVGVYCINVFVKHWEARMGGGGVERVGDEDLFSFFNVIRSHLQDTNSY